MQASGSPAGRPGGSEDRAVEGRPPGPSGPKAGSPPVAGRRKRVRKSNDLLANLPPELEGLIVSDVGSRPPPRPVLWGRNLEAQKTEELNLDFESTEKEVIDEFESIPKLSLEDLARAAARRKKAGKGCPGKDAAGKDEAGKDEAGKDGDLPCDDR